VSVRVLAGRVCPLRGESQRAGTASVELQPHRILATPDVGTGPVTTHGPEGTLVGTPDVVFDIVTAPRPGAPRPQASTVDISHRWRERPGSNELSTLTITWDTHDDCRLVELRYTIRGEARRLVDQSNSARRSATSRA